MAAAEEGASRESQASVTGDARAWAAGALASPARTTEERVGPRGSSRAESDLAVGHDEDLGRPCRRLGLSGERDRLLHTRDRGMESLASLPDRRRADSGRTSRTARLPEGSRAANVTLTTDNGTQFTSSRFLETLGRLGITHRRTAYHHPEGNGYIERFHRSLKEEEVWTAEYRSVEEARAASLAGSRSTITTGLIGESEIALRTRPSRLLQVY